MNCSKCGSENPNGAKFCRHCGSLLDTSEADSPTLQNWQQNTGVFKVDLQTYPVGPISKGLEFYPPPPQPGYAPPAASPSFQKSMGDTLFAGEATVPFEKSKPAENACPMCRYPLAGGSDRCPNCGYETPKKQDWFATRPLPGFQGHPTVVEPFQVESPIYLPPRTSLSPKPPESVLEMKPGDEFHGYEIEKFVAEGTYAKVFKVKDLLDGSSYAMKVLKIKQLKTDWEREEVRARFEREFKIGQWRNPFLINSYDRGEIRNNPFQVLEWMSDGSLTQYIRPDLPFDMVAKILTDVLNGLAFLHEKGVVHRDIKPQNVLVKNGEHKLADFGIAYFGKAQKSAALAEENVYGTMPYLAPEAFDGSRGQSRYSPATDIFAFGVLAFELITGGTLPFGSIMSKAEADVYRKNAAEKRYFFMNAIRADVPEAWEELVDRCIEPAPENRADSAEGLIAEIKNITKGKTAPIVDPKGFRYRYDIFLSHATEDIEFSRMVHKALTVRGFNVFFSPITLEDSAGQSFSEKIDEALNESQHFILVCSQISLYKEWVKAEYQTFHNECYMKQPQNRRFIPLPVPQFDLNKMPLLLRRFQVAKSPEDVVKILHKI